MVNIFLDILKNLIEFWIKNCLVGKVNDMLNRFCEREEFGFLDDFCKVIIVDEIIYKILLIC